MNKHKDHVIGIQVCMVGREKCFGRPLYNITYDKPKLQVCDKHYNEEAAIAYRQFLADRHNPLPTSLDDHTAISAYQSPPVQSGEPGDNSPGGTGSEIRTA
jgi:hypothetical protein